MSDPVATSRSTQLCDLLGCDVPVLLAGMGGVAHWDLAAAVANAGGYGMLGMVREPVSLIRQEVTALRAATSRPFAVNVIPSATESGLLEAQISCCLELAVPAFTFFWDVVPRVVERVKQAGAQVLHQVGTVEAARIAEAAGADVLIAQGVEAGGHVHGRRPTFDLTAGILEQTALPVVASGGLGTGADLARALQMGAAGIQCGTAFLATEESFAHPYHKGRVVLAGAGDTVLTDVFVLNWPKGAAVRVLQNSVTRALDGAYLGHDPDLLPRETIAWDNGQPLLRFSTDSPMRGTTGDLAAMALYAGEGVAGVRSIVPAAVRLAEIVDGARAILSRQGEGAAS